MSTHVIATPRAVELIRRLRRQFGPIVIHQGSGCCNGSSLFCVKREEFHSRPEYTLFDLIEDTPVLLGPGYAWQALRAGFTIDVEDGESDNHSLENCEGVHFVNLPFYLTAAASGAKGG